jgi:hypothetical protein
MSTPGEQAPSAEAKVASNDVEETVLTVKEKKEETEKAPISNFWVCSLQSTTAYALLTDDSAFFLIERSKMGLLCSSDLAAQSGRES